MFFYFYLLKEKRMSNVELHNKLNRAAAEKKISKELFNRTVLSFYKYVTIEEPRFLRNYLFSGWKALDVLGRIYVAKEGINAQVSVPDHHLKNFRDFVDSISYFKDLAFKSGLEKNNLSFFKLTIKVKSQIVADGLDAKEYDVTDTGKHLSAKDWNQLTKSGSIIVDMRNHYESEVGHFEGAILPETETFKEALPSVKKLLKGKEKDNLLLYCTGGIRCEKASAYLKHSGFKNVHHLSGGIVKYTNETEELVLKNYFRGKNFVFDNRLGERVSEDILSNCHQCGVVSDDHTNCQNLNCNLLFIQCNNCKVAYNNCCSPNCVSVVKLPIEKQKKLRRKKRVFHSHKKVNLMLAFKK